MVSIFKSLVDGKNPVLVEKIEKGCWINLINPSDNEVEFVSQQTGIDEEILKTALDEEETAQLDREDGVTMLVMDIPYIEDADEWYTYNTVPLGIAFNEDYFVTVSLQENIIFNDFQVGRIRNFKTENKVKFLLQILSSTAQKFLQYLRHIDKTNLRIQAKLYKSMKNKELLQLLDLEKSLVYFSTSLRANSNILKKVMKFEEFRNDEDYQEYLEDVMLEYNQAVEMCNIYRDIMSGTMDAFASIISNNINVVMKVLTIITIILTVPTLIASLWGMNVPVPFAENSAGFWIVIAVSILVTILVSIIIIKKTNRIGRRR